MNICDRNHEEVCYEGKYCPLCDTITDKNQEIKDLEKQIERLEAYISRLESEGEYDRRTRIETGRDNPR